MVKLINVNEIYRIIPKINFSNISLLDPLLQPDRSSLSVYPNKSIFYWNNKTAISGRNPVRLFILPLNNLGRPVQVGKVEVESPYFKKLDIFYPDDYAYRIKPWFIDISAKSSIETKISIKINDIKVVDDVSIKFIPDCQKEIYICIRQPSNFFQYIFYLTQEQWNKLAGY